MANLAQIRHFSSVNLKEIHLKKHKNFTTISQILYNISSPIKFKGEKMKKMALGLVLCISGLFAGGMDLNGLITAIDNQNKTITINGVLVQVLPQTKIKLDDCGIFGTDLAGKFVDLKQGSFVEAEVFPNMSSVAGQYATQNAGATGAPVYIAEEIELKCTRNRAY